jgi:hypothetical protein
VGIIRWTDDEAISLSQGAAQLLRSLSGSSVSVGFDRSSGGYFLISGVEATTRVNPRTLETLVRTRLVTRSRDARFVAYVITERGKKAVTSSAMNLTERAESQRPQELEALR